MPYDSTTKIISKPVSIPDVRRALSSGTGDLGTNIIDGNINMWAKYKPVVLRKLAVNDTVKASGDEWNGTLQPETSMPWWYGRPDSPVYVVPIIEQWSDIGYNGIQNDAMKWTYNRPAGRVPASGNTHIDEFFRLADFCGYYADARQPLVAVMPNALDADGTAHYIGVTFITADEEAQEFGWDDLKYFFGNQDVYLGAYIKVGSNPGAGYIKSYPLSDENDADLFALTIHNGSLTWDGATLACNAGDNVYIYLFLSTAHGTSDVDNAQKFSLLLNDGVVYRKYQVGVHLIVVKFAYSYAFNLTYLDISTYNIFYVKDSNDNIFKCTHTLNAMRATVNVERASQNAGSSDYDWLRVSVFGNGTLTWDDDGTPRTRQFDCVTSQIVANQTNGNLRSAQAISISGTASTFTYYATEQDARNDNPAGTRNGTPIYDEVVENNMDQDETGPITNRFISLMVSLSPATGNVTYEATRTGIDVNLEELLNP